MSRQYNIDDLFIAKMLISDKTLCNKNKEYLTILRKQDDDYLDLRNNKFVSFHSKDYEVKFIAPLNKYYQQIVNIKTKQKVKKIKQL